MKKGLRRDEAEKRANVKTAPVRAKLAERANGNRKSWTPTTQGMEQAAVAFNNKHKTWVSKIFMEAFPTTG